MGMITAHTRLVLFVKSGFRYEVKLMILLCVDKCLCDFAHVFGQIVSSGEKTNKNLVASREGKGVTSGSRA